MIFPSEVVVRYLIPTIRFLLTEELKKKGLTEGAIARRLGISQSAVSKYGLGKVRIDEGFSEDPKLREKVKIVAQGMADGRLSGFQALAEFLPLIYEYENRGRICELHEMLMPELRGLNCDLCVRLGRSLALEEEEVLADLRQALRLLENLKGFPSLIPNVGSNLAMAKRGARDPLEVAAIPGRIYEVKGQVKIPAPPEFGASKHVAEVVLAAIHLDPNKRAAINLAHNPSLLEGCEKLDWDLLEMEAKYEGRRERLKELMRRRGRVPDVVYHRGDFGIEPITYILGSSALEVVRRVEALLGVLR